LPYAPYLHLGGCPPMKSLIGFVILVGLLALAGVSTASRIGATRRIDRFEQAVRALARSVAAPESDPVQERVVALATEADLAVEPARVKVRIAELELEHLGRLLLEERQEAQRHLSARERFWYVEIGVTGQAKWLLGSADFDFEHHVPGGPIGR
jgi:N-acetylglutamate synthase/N-acetylornithine aminotransferase